MSIDPILDIVFEDDDLLIVNKPADLVCHPTKAGEWSSLVGRVRLYLGTGEGRLVNRLDRETSGLVVIAKNAGAARQLGRLFESGRIEKHYIAIVHGHVSRAGITIDAPIGDDLSSEVAIKGCVRPDGAAATSTVALRQTFHRDGAAFSLVDVIPLTGRKHQIRIHLAHIGHPVVGDKLYGGDERRYLRFVHDALTDDDRACLMVPTQALHAAELKCIWRDQPRAWTAPTPKLFAQFLDRLAQTAAPASSGATTAPV